MQHILSHEDHMMIRELVVANPGIVPNDYINLAAMPNNNGNNGITGITEITGNGNNGNGNNGNGNKKGK